MLGATLDFASGEAGLAGYNACMQDEACYLCDHCGEEIVIPIDLSLGPTQEYVEDCPVCCHPSVIHVILDEGGVPHVSSAPE